MVKIKTRRKDIIAKMILHLYRFIYFQSSFEGFGIPFLIADFWALCLIVLNGLSEIFSALKREDVNKSDNKYVFMI